jgi:hypothetical protein
LSNNRREQALDYVSALTDSEFEELVAEARGPQAPSWKERKDMAATPDPEMRKMLRHILGQAEPEPVSGPNIVPNEGRTTGKPGITPEQYTADFIKRVTGAIPAAAEQLPEQE